MDDVNIKIGSNMEESNHYHEIMLKNIKHDLITPINPQSHYTFINYLHKTGKYFKYYGSILSGFIELLNFSGCLAFII